MIFPVEGGRWLVTLMGGDGDTPPTDEAGFLDFARSLRSPDVFEAIRDAEPLTPIACQRKIENRLRHYDRLGRSPEGLIVLGDAACAFNPVYGQGMTAAALGAEVLGRWLRRPPGAPGSCRRFQRDLARSIAAPWLLSTGADYRFKTTVGPTPGPASRWVQGYIDELFRLSTRHAGARRRMAGVFHLLRPPSALFGPDIMGPLVWNRLMRRSPAGWTAPEGPVGAIAGLHDAGNGSIPSRVEGR